MHGLRDLITDLQTSHQTLWEWIKSALFGEPKPVPVRVKRRTSLFTISAMSLAAAGLLGGCGEGEYPVPYDAAGTTATTVSSASGPTTQASGPAVTRVEKTKEQWKAELSAEAFHILFEAGTERPFANAYYKNHAKGTYVSAATGAALFSSEDKFESGTGWPSFTKPLNANAVILRPDPDGSGRGEVLDASSGGHLGHVFPDGPQDKGGLRYCMNSAAMKFIPAK